MIRLVPATCLLLAVIACERNHAPVISGITCIPDTRHAGTLFTFRVNASDEEGSTLLYRWNAGDGTILTAENIREIQWQSPVDGAGKTIVMRVTVSDGEKETGGEYPLTLEEPLTGGFEGYVYFTQFKVPVPDATVSLGGLQCKTDSNGFFGFYGIPAINYTFTVTKESFTTFTAPVKLAPDDTLSARAEITSVNYTTKLSGYVYNQNGDPEPDVSLVVLNPDGSTSNLKYTSESNGHYQLRYIPFGERTIVASKEAFGDYSYTTLEFTRTFDEIETALDLVITRKSLNGTFTDPRDQRVYTCRTYGSGIWMTENLAYLPSVYPADDLSGKEERYYVYDYSGTDTAIARRNPKCGLYGVLYNWPAAKTACPPGWRVPTYLDWIYLVYDLSPESGKKMKSESGWNWHGGGTNLGRFNGRPGGQLNVDGLFLSEGDAAFFWTSTESSYLQPTFFNLLYNSDEAVYHKGSVKMGMSVRCIKN